MSLARSSLRVRLPVMLVCLSVGTAIADLYLMPADARVLPAERLIMRAQMFEQGKDTGQPVAGVQWSVHGNGTICSTGLYTAPSLPSEQPDSIIASITGNGIFLRTATAVHCTETPPLEAGFVRRILNLRKGLSPFVQVDSVSLETDYLGGEEAVLPHAGDTARIGPAPCRWTAVEDLGGNWGTLSSPAGFVSYWYIEIMAGQSRTVALRYLSYDPIKVLHNGTVLFSDPVEQFTGPRISEPLSLVSGTNRFLFKIADRNPDNLFAVQFVEILERV